MSLPDWIEEDCNDAFPPGPGRRVDLIGGSVTEGNGTWMNWDLVVPAGTYELSRISTNSAWQNYFVIGGIATKLQPQIMDPRHRRCFIASWGQWSTTRRFQHQGLLRIESWYVHPDRENTRPYPAGYAGWPMLEQGGGDIISPRFNMFMRHFPSISKRLATPDQLVFHAEDASDGDFNDLVCALRKVA